MCVSKEIRRVLTEYDDIEFTEADKEALIAHEEALCWGFDIPKSAGV